VRAPFAIAAAAGAAYALPLAAPRVPWLAHALAIQTTLVLPGPHLTFEGVPDPKVLELLRERDLNATFFLLGAQVRRSGVLRDEIEAAGHAIGLQGDSGRPLWRLTPRALRDDLDRGEEAVRPTADLHRAPRGVYSLPALYEVMGRGFNPLLWSRSGGNVTRDLGPHDVLRIEAGHYALLPAVLDAVIAAQPR
jgi:peptidoglycan/xylan/chitin deacetylase (PgdA/CDA1 family)